jgi:hypothetical protein
METTRPYLIASQQLRHRSPSLDIDTRQSAEAAETRSATKI